MPSGATKLPDPPSSSASSSRLGVRSPSTQPSSQPPTPIRAMCSSTATFVPWIAPSQKIGSVMTVQHE
ncbi:MAG: hypothetical protein U0521_05060 [Anaerolineae bacterium]